MARDTGVRDVAIAGIGATPYYKRGETAVAAFDAMGYKNVMFGSDYPHMEGTYGHTQDTLKALFDGVSEKTRQRITQGAFFELFPQVPPVPAGEA